MSRSRSRYGRDGPVIHVDSGMGRMFRAPSRALNLVSRLFTGVDSRQYGHASSNVIYLDEDGRAR
jgi:hypothetical protein